MPNFWSKILQQTYECFNGPRTLDYDFEKKVQEFQTAKERMSLIKISVLGFPTRTNGIASFCLEVYNNFSLPYDKGSLYYKYINDVCEAHKALEKAYSTCKDAVFKLSKEMEIWDGLFTEVDSLIKKRIELRKTYDHYDEKMEKLVKQRNERFAKGRKESTKDVEEFEKNEEKFKKAATEFIEISNQTYFKIQEFLDHRYKLMTPIVFSLVENEKQFYNQAHAIFDYFRRAWPSVKDLGFSLQKTPITYNAADSLRGRHILGKNFCAGHSQTIESGIINGTKDLQGMNKNPNMPQNQGMNPYQNISQNSSSFNNINPYKNNQFPNQNMNQMKKNSANYNNSMQFNQGFPQGNNSGFGNNPGFPQGNNPGFPQGNNPGFPQGNNPGFPQGNNPGFPQGNNPGFPQGNNPGFPQGNNLGFPQGNNLGFPQGNDLGFPQGNNLGFSQRKSSNQMFPSNQQKISKIFLDKEDDQLKNPFQDEFDDNNKPKNG